LLYLDTSELLELRISNSGLNPILLICELNTLRKKTKWKYTQNWNC